MTESRNLATLEDFTLLEGTVYFEDMFFFFVKAQT